MRAISVEAFLDAWERAPTPSGRHDRERSGAGTFKVTCPLHVDSQPSLEVRQGRDGKLLLKCFGACRDTEVYRPALEAVGLWENERIGANGATPGARRVTARYRYNDANGELVFEVWRYEPKDFKPHHLNAVGEWVPRDPPGVKLPLYRLPELLAADPKQPVFICAGEKDADNLARLGLVATTNPHGESVHWRRQPQWLEPLEGRRCVILEDYDRPDKTQGRRAGEEHSKEVFRALTEAGIEAKRLLLPGLVEGQDVSDWLGAGHTAEELLQLSAPEPHPLDLRVKTGPELAALVLPTPEALVPNLMYRGMSTLLAGDSKLGKSSLILRMILAMATGGWWLDRECRPENRLPVSRVLFVNFEDPLVLTQSRSLRMMAPEGLPENFLTMEPPYGFSLNQVIDWLGAARERFDLDAVVLDPIAIAAEWEKEEDNAQVALTFKALQRLAVEAQLAILSAHHVSKKPGTFGLNIRGASAIKANVMGYLVLEREREQLKLSGINKLTGEWDVSLGRDESDLSWWIEETRSGHTRTPQQAAKDEAKADLVLLIGAEPGVTTERLAELVGLKYRTCGNYLAELEAVELIFTHELSREPGQRGRSSVGWFRCPSGEA